MPRAFGVVLYTQTHIHIYVRIKYIHTCIHAYIHTYPVYIFIIF